MVVDCKNFVVNYDFVSEFYSSFKFKEVDSKEKEIDRLYFNMLKSSKINSDFYSIFDDLVKFTKFDYLHRFFYNAEKLNDLLIKNNLSYEDLKPVVKNYGCFSRKKEKVDFFSKLCFNTSKKLVKLGYVNQNFEKIFEAYSKGFTNSNIQKYFVAVNKTMDFAYESYMNLDSVAVVVDILKLEIKENKKNVLRSNIDSLLSQKEFSKFLDVGREYLLYLDYKKTDLVEIYSNF